MRCSILTVAAVLSAVMMLACGDANAAGKRERDREKIETEMLEVRDQMKAVREAGGPDDVMFKKLMALTAKHAELVKKRNELRAPQRLADWNDPGEVRVMPRGIRGGRLRTTTISRIVREVGVVDVELNLRDAAHFEIARMLCKAESYDEAVAELGKVAKSSPEKPAVSAAHLSMGNISRRHLGDADKAIDHYSKVKGELTEQAIEAMIDTFDELDEPDRAKEYIEKLIEKTADAETKVRLLYGLAELLRDNDEGDAAIAALRRIPGIISYEDALKVRKKPAAKKAVPINVYGGPRRR